ncbi:hypothetical protein [Alkalihalobacterium bogoriense]|uniref:hypothetical protein n=1 Tax=Alkalihalobacterium bogoriense TaxID=246272 RepID=UPI000478F9EF|nr:hypothetical protein [Alkalihalobacterium bogoriense]
MNQSCKRLLVIALLSLLLSFPLQAQAIMMNNSVRITVVEQDTVYEWEYDNPNKYEYEEGETVIRGEKAKVEVEKIISALKLKEDSDRDELLNRLKQHGFSQVTRMDIRLMNEKGELFTWVWEQNEERT